MFLVLSVIQIEPRELKELSAQYPRTRFDMEQADRKLKEFGKEEGVTIIHLTPVFRRAIDKGNGPLFGARRVKKSTARWPGIVSPPMR